MVGTCESDDMAEVTGTCCVSDKTELVESATVAPDNSCLSDENDPKPTEKRCGKKVAVVANKTDPNLGRSVLAEEVPVKMAHTSVKGDEHSDEALCVAEEASGALDPDLVVLTSVNRW